MKLTGPARRRAFWSAGVLAVLVIAAVIMVAVSHGGKAVPVASSTTTVQRGTVTLAVSAAGTITAADTRGLSFSVAGTLTEVDVKAGDLVTVGEVLARIDPTAAQATVDTATSRVSDAQNAVDRALAAAAVPTCPPTTAPVATATGSPSPGGTGHAGGGTGGTGGSGGGGGGGGSGGTGTNVTPTCTTAGRNTSTTDNVLSAQQQLNNAELSLRQAQTKLAGTVITAPIAGRVLSVGGKVGNTTSPGGTGFVVLGDIANLAVSAQFSEADVGRLAIGQASTITLPNSSTPLPGKVSQIDPAGTVSSRLVRYGVIIAFDAVPADLLIGESATVLVTTASAADVLYVASAAVTGVAGGAGTVTVRANGRDERRTVKIGLRGDQFTEIRSGLASGDQVVLPSAA
jgi:multidrug efflux pump subunit AcrA (membrane-fusion protein)